MSRLLRDHFVCVTLDSEEVAQGTLQPASDLPALRALKDEVYRRIAATHGAQYLVDEARCIDNKVGYVLSPDGKLLDYAITRDIHEKDRLEAFLRSVIQRRGLQARPATAGAAPARAGAVTLSHVGRYLSINSAAYRRVVSVTPYGQLAAEDRIPLDPSEVAVLVPLEPRVGDEWEPDPAVTRRLLSVMRPPTHETKFQPEAAAASTLKATVTKVEGDRVEVALRGRLLVDSPEFRDAVTAVGLVPQPILEREGWRMEADLVGYLVARGQSLEEFQLVTVDGTWRTPDPDVAISYGSFLTLEKP